MTMTDLPESSTIPPTRRFEDVAVGDTVPGDSIVLTPTLVIGTAIATRDFEEVHHDVEVARAKGLDNIFLNILTTNGLCQRVVVDWAGPDARVVRASVRLGVPALAGDTLELTAEVVATELLDGAGLVTVEVLAMVSSGRHGKATIVVDLPVTAQNGDVA